MRSLFCCNHCYPPCLPPSSFPPTPPVSSPPPLPLLLAGNLENKSSLFFPFGLIDFDLSSIRSLLPFSGGIKEERRRKDNCYNLVYIFVNIVNIGKGKGKNKFQCGQIIFVFFSTSIFIMYIFSPASLQIRQQNREKIYIYRLAWRRAMYLSWRKRELCYQRYRRRSKSRNLTGKLSDLSLQF